MVLSSNLMSDLQNISQLTTATFLTGEKKLPKTLLQFITLRKNDIIVADVVIYKAHVFLNLAVFE